MGDDDRARALKRDPESADLTNRERAMLEFSRKLTNAPSDMGRCDVEELRKAGLDDAAIVELVSVTAYFNFINRVALGLGVRLDEALEGAAEAADLAREEARLSGE